MNGVKPSITCVQCKAVHTVGQMLHRRAVADEVFAVGLLCPDCGHWVHSFFETTEIIEKRDALKQAEDRFQTMTAGPRRAQLWTEYQTSKAAFARLFEREQQRLRRKYGVAQNTANAP